MNVDHRADIYSVGVMLYEMLCGEVPKGSFDKPSRRIGCDVRIDRIVIRATQQSPENRYQSAEEMKAQVAVAGALGRSRRSRFRIIAFAGGLALVAGAGVFSSHWFGEKTTGAPPTSARKPPSRDLSAESSKNRPATVAASLATPAANTPAPLATGPMTREEQVNAAANAAQELEEKGDWGKSLEAWLRVAKDYPEFPQGKSQLEMLLQHLYELQPPISPEAFEGLRPQITESAQLDLPMAMLLLGDNLHKENPTEALSWYSKAAAKGNAMAETAIGVTMLQGGAPDSLSAKQAVGHFQTAADKGDTGGKVALSQCYRTGFGVTKDPKRAVELLREAADAGDPKAMNNLGDQYVHGEGVAKDLTEAFNLFDKAQARGCKEAKGNLGLLYLAGQGVAANPKKAEEVFSDGAKDGDAFCMMQFAKCLEYGTGVSKDSLKAMYWYRKAAAAGSDDAIKWCIKHSIAISP
jgi:TPR repeat protein